MKSPMNVLCLLVIFASSISKASSEVTIAKSDRDQIEKAKAVSSVMASAMGRRLVHNDLLMIGSRMHAKRRTEAFLQTGVDLQGGSIWAIILLLVVMLAIMMTLYLVATQTDDSEYKPLIVPGRPIDSAKQLDPFLQEKHASPMPGRVFPPQQQSPAAERHLPGAPPQSPSVGFLGLGQTYLSPVSTSRAAWSTKPGVPPPLNPREVPPQTKKSYRIAVPSLRKLYGHTAIEVTGAFDHPQYYARLAFGAEGSRLEIAAEPSWGYLVATIGRLDYPAMLSPDALVHGPDREYYGPFQRYGSGFSVGHWSHGQHGQVLTLAPRKNWTGGFFIEVKSGSADVASVQLIDNGQRYQIEVQGGVDNVLIIAAVLASFVASQPMIDESGTRI